jgi:hypothetical protein
VDEVVTHPRHALDPVIHPASRFSIMAVLVSADKVEFRFVRDTVEISDSALSQHMTTLEQDGYLKVTKGQVGRRPRTCCQPRRLDDQPSPATSPPSTRSHTQRHQVVDWNW